MIKPILFNTEMVRAILEGRKTVTRRAVKLKGYAVAGIPSWNVGKHGEFWFDVVQKGREPSAKTATCRMIAPPYQIGDTMWVRETYRENEFPWDEEDFVYKADEHNADWTLHKWHPSIHMPKEAARLFLRVMDVRAERLQDIDVEGCKAEGISDCYKTNSIVYLENLRKMAYPKVFSELWDSTIKPADRSVYGWEANPWVWVIEFERCEKPEGWG